MDVAHGLEYLHRNNVPHGNLKGVRHLVLYDRKEIHPKGVRRLIYSSATVVRHEPYSQIMV